MSTCSEGVNYAISIPYLTGMNGKLIGQVSPYKIFTEKKIAQKGKASFQKMNREEKNHKNQKRKKLENANS